MSNIVLIAEDDPAMQKMAMKILRSAGFNCQLARNGREALSLAAELKPRLILMDLSLPDMNGWEATRKIKADPSLSSVTVVAVTAHAMVGDKESALAAGCDEVLTKPYELSALLALVRRYVGPSEAAA